MKHIRLALLFAVLLTAVFPIQAQKLIDKELQTENNEKDGFEYKWYMYKYDDGTLAAFDINGKRITPNIDGISIMYIGGGGFAIITRYKDSFGDYISEGYNSSGFKFIKKGLECRLIYYYVGYKGVRYFILIKKNKYGRDIEALYDEWGLFIIPFSKGYNTILWSELDSTFTAFYTDSNGEFASYHVYTPDRQLIKEGNYHRDSEASVASGSGQSSNASHNNASASNDNSGLLYKGMYSDPGDCTELTTGNHMSVTGTGTHSFEIYDDYLTVDGVRCDRHGNSGTGERKYFGYGGLQYCVDNSYNIRKIIDVYAYGATSYSCRLIKGESTMPSTANSGYNSSNAGQANTSRSHGQSGSHYEKKTYTCTYCNGKGTVADCDNSIVDYTGNKKWCSECGKYVPACHIHKRCPSCNGKGTYTKMERTN